MNTLRIWVWVCSTLHTIHIHITCFPLLLLFTSIFFHIYFIHISKSSYSSANATQSLHFIIIFFFHFSMTKNQRFSKKGNIKKTFLVFWTSVRKTWLMLFSKVKKSINLKEKNSQKQKKTRINKPESQTESKIYERNTILYYSCWREKI